MRSSSEPALSVKSAETAALSSTHSPLGTHGLWGSKSDQLPAYIQNIAKAMIRSGHDESSAISLAVGAVKRWARGGGKVSPEVRAAAAKAVGEWEALRAKHGGSKSVTEADVEKFRLHFNPLELRDARGRWARSRESKEADRESRRLQEALRPRSNEDNPLSHITGGGDRHTRVRYRGATRKLNPSVAHVSEHTVRANPGADMKAPPYLRSDVHVLAGSQRYTDAQVHKLQAQLDELKSEMREDSHKEAKFSSYLKIGVISAGIGLELFHGGDPASLALFGALFLKSVPEFIEPIGDYIHHLREHDEQLIRPTPYAKKSAAAGDEVAATAVRQAIAGILVKLGADEASAQRYAATVTSAAVEARAAGRREFNGDFVSDSQVQRMASQFGGSGSAEKEASAPDIKKKKT